MIASTNKSGRGFLFVLFQKDWKIMENVWFTASIWIGIALAASLISIRLGISVALIEILLGTLGGNILNLQTMPWIDSLAGFGAVVLTFLAGAEIEPAAFKRNLKASLVIGILSFLLPFLGAWLFAYYVAHWEMQAALIAGVALSTTSVAVVYAVMIETKLNETDLGRLILAACFITDLGTVLALGILFAKFDIWMLVFILVLAPVLIILPKLLPVIARRWSGRISEPEIKLLLLVLFVLAGFATAGKSEAVLPAYLVGLVSAGYFFKDRVVLHRLRTIAFAVFTPFYFIKAGLYISFPAIVTGALLIVALLGVKVAAKFIGVYPSARLFRFDIKTSNYMTLLMSTGLTFGTISALYGLTNNLIDRTQYTILVTVVLGSAVIPTLIAQTWFRPDGGEMQVVSAVDAEDVLLVPEMDVDNNPGGE
jgi:Kef-type K+ transport system membrane component KefB